MKRLETTVFLFVCLLSLVAPGSIRTAAAQTGGSDNAGASTNSNQAAAALSVLAFHAREGAEAAKENDLAAMKRESIELKSTWGAVEDSVRAADPGLYGEIEAALHRVEAALSAKPLVTTETTAAFDHLLDEIDEGVEHLGAGLTTAAPVAGGASLTDFQAQLTAARAGVAARSEVDSENAVLAALNLWPGIEGAVAAKSSTAYETVEAQLGTAAASLQAEPADWAAAEMALETMQAALAPIGAEQTYTVFDSAAIMLREGLEALLVIAALLAVLRRSNNQDKQIWIWGGAVLGIALSIAVAFILQAVFSQVAGGQNRELIEGITSLIAAGLLIYVSYWLHSKASLRGWQRYIDAGTAKALAKGNLIGLGLLALLAVFREGAETTIFYIGMAPAISPSDLLLGIGIGILLLGVAAWLMLVGGVRLPVRLFFRIAGLLVFYLGFKFVGTGIHNLQVAGVVGTTPIPFLPAIPVVGIYPTWQTLIPQLLMLAFAVAMALRLHAQDRQLAAAAATA
jgi:high-affinity iron transporter